MATLTKLYPKTTEVKRSELRQEQSSILAKAVGEHVIVVRARSGEAEKYIVDKRYFDEILQKLKSLMETLEITADSKFFAKLVRAAETVDEDIRLGKLRSFEEAFD